MKVTFVHKGNFNNLERFLVRAVKIKPVIRAILGKYGRRGVKVLEEATPKDTGLTANSWSYDIEEYENGMRIVWKNSNVQNGQLIAILLQYGHATRNGGYVQGIDYINPAISAVFQEMADDAWKEVTS
jgi:hypothetical protein